MVSHHDRQILRDLAKQVAEIAALPVMEQRRQLWKKHNSLQRVRPLILVFPEGAWAELLPASSLACEGDAARGMEADLRSRIYTHEHFHADNVIEAEWVVNKVIHNSGWGIQARHHASTQPRGAWAFDPVIRDHADLNKLRFPQIAYDPESTHSHLTAAEELFGDILDVKLKGIAHISFHMMSLYTSLRGLEQVMYDMVEEPAMLHDAMAFLEAGHRNLVLQYEEQDLFSLNNDGTYHSSGGVGYTDEIPAADFDPEHVRPCDMWSSAEAQELAQVSPEMHEEFILSYERRLLQPFALNGYGCCEDLTLKLDQVLTIPNIRRISISPFACVDRCAEKLKGDFIFSWKPQPAHLVGDFNSEQVRDYIGHTLSVARDCVLEIILKDTHTCQGHPERFDEWTRIARELVEDAAEGQFHEARRAGA